MFKRLMVLVCAVFAGLVLAACGPSNADGPKVSDKYIQFDGTNLFYVVVVDGKHYDLTGTAYDYCHVGNVYRGGHCSH